MNHQTPSHWHRRAVATLLTLLAALGMAGTVAAAPTPPAPPVPGAIGPINPAVLQPQGAFTRPVTEHGYTVYVNARGETATGAVALDAVRGFAPAKAGRSYGPDTLQPGCTPGDLPDQATQDHATFTAAQLRQYNLPSASDLGIPFAEWATMMRAAKHVACSSRLAYDGGHPSHSSVESSAHLQQPQAGLAALDTCIDFCEPEADITTTPPGTNCPGTTVFICEDRHVHGITGPSDPYPSEPAWVGFGTDRYHCTSGTCPSLTEATSYWHVPTAYYKDADFDFSSAWVGLGGAIDTSTATCAGSTATAPSLVQAGTESFHEGGHPAPAQYDAWFENCSSNIPGKWVVGFSINPGDLMVAYIGYSSSAHPSSIYLQDFTNGWTDNLLDGPGSIWPAPDQNTAECVQESPATPQWEDGGVWHGLTDFGNLGIHFEFCRAWTGYNTSTIKGLGSMPNETMINFRDYAVNGTPAYCESTQWWDTANPTYGLTSYYQSATVTIAEGGNTYC